MLQSRWKSLRIQGWQFATLFFGAGAVDVGREVALDLDCLQQGLFLIICQLTHLTSDKKGLFSDLFVVFVCSVRAGEALPLLPTCNFIRIRQYALIFGFLHEQIPTNYPITPRYLTILARCRFVYCVEGWYAFGCLKRTHCRRVILLLLLTNTIVIRGYDCALRNRFFVAND